MLVTWKLTIRKPTIVVSIADKSRVTRKALVCRLIEMKDYIKERFCSQKAEEKACAFKYTTFHIDMARSSHDIFTGIVRHRNRLG